MDKLDYRLTFDPDNKNEISEKNLLRTTFERFFPGITFFFVWICLDQKLIYNANCPLPLASIKPVGPAGILPDVVGVGVVAGSVVRLGVVVGLSVVVGS
jgi:hypothetical protein